MNIPEGFVLVPVERGLIEAIAYFDKGHRTVGEIQLWAKDALMRHDNPIISAAPPKTIYDEAVELAACRAHWEKNPNCLFSDMWLGWKACAQSRDGSVSDE